MYNISLSLSCIYVFKALKLMFIVIDGKSYFIIVEINEVKFLHENCLNIYIFK